MPNTRLLEKLSQRSVPLVLSRLDDHDAPIIFINHAFEKLTGYTSNDVLEQDCRFLQGPETDRAITADMGNKIRDHQPAQATVLNYHKSGTPFHNFLIIQPLHAADGQRLLLGCQFAFNAEVVLAEIEQHTYAFDQALQSARTTQAVAHQTRRRSMELTADLIHKQVKSYLGHLNQPTAEDTKRLSDPASQPSTIKRG